MNNSKSLSEIWTIREKLYEESKHLTSKERADKLHEETKSTIDLIRKKQAQNLIH